MVYKFHQYKFDNMNRYYDVIREAMNQLGHSEAVEDSSADIHFYNHIVNDEKSNNMIIVKPTAPTAKHFALDNMVMLILLKWHTKILMYMNICIPI